MNRLLNAACVLITIALTAFGIHELGYIVRPTATDGAYLQTSTFHKLPKNSIDVIVYGSSHAFRGINTMELYNKYGIGAYNYGWHWQGINTTKLFIKDSLITQTPKLVVIEAFYAGRVLENTQIDPEIYYSRYLNISNQEYLQQCFGDDLEGYLSYYMPLCAFHDNWVNITRDSFQALPEQNNLFDTMGFSPSDRSETVVLPSLDELTEAEQNQLSPQAIEELNDIVSICREIDADICFVTVPYEGVYRYNDAMKEFADNNGCSYLNLFYHIEEVGLDVNTDFSDKGHLNTNGSIKVSDYIGKYIIENYPQIPDMRRISGNQWTRTKAMSHD